MPGRDGSGPLGQGNMSGRGLGYCAGIHPAYYGAGRRLGYGRGFRRFYSAEPYEPRSHKDLLEEERDLLLGRLEYVKKQLEGICED